MFKKGFKERSQKEKGVIPEISKFLSDGSFESLEGARKRFYGSSYYELSGGYISELFSGYISPLYNLFDRAANTFYEVFV